MVQKTPNKKHPTYLLWIYVASLVMSFLEQAIGFSSNRYLKQKKQKTLDGMNLG